MKRNILFLLLLTILQMACNNKKTVKELKEENTLQELNNILIYKTDSSSINLTEKEEKTAELAEVDTLIEAASGMKALYGPDDRIDFYEETDQNKIKNSMGVVALVHDSDLELLPGNLQQLTTIPFNKANNLCDSETFRLQPTASFCTGFAIDKNILVTAGHCIKNNAELATIRFLFDYKNISANETVTKFNNKQIVTGKRIISRQLDNKGNDFAIIETNESIPQDRILSVNFKSRIKNKEFVYVIGHPVGLPQKIADGSHVRVNAHPLFFTANLDTYGGNSGSPVFNSETHLVEGILVRGATDFVIGKSGNCFVSNTCPDSGCDGEDVSRISQIKSFVNIVGNHNLQWIP